MRGCVSEYLIEIAPFGWLSCHTACDDQLVRITLGAATLTAPEPDATPICIREVQRWVDAYTAGKRPLSYEASDLGTAFQQSVWRAIAQIPYGETRTYRDIAESIGAPTAMRAVGNACGANPLPLVVPCHRVIAQHGLGGFSGPAAWKKRLLDFEHTTHMRIAV